MTTGTPLPAFEHDPLPEHTSHFRLVHIVRGDFGQHVECEISIWPIDNAPAYYAISYTWGDPADTTEITVNGRPLVVRRNCEYVLQQAFASKSSNYFWVDAICIAQTTEEKNHQVGIMGDIYSKAWHVLACVGPHENDSGFITEAIQEYRSLIKKIRKRQLPWDKPWGNPIAKRRRLYFRCIFRIEPEIRRRLYQSFCSFMRRPYFQRLWIIQELHLAYRVTYCFGTAGEAAEDLPALYQLLHIWTDGATDYLSFSVQPLAIFVRSKLPVARSRTIASRAMQSTFSDIWPASSRLQFACTRYKQAVHNILLDPNLQCSDPRDRLFGILSVVDPPPGNDVPKPDYTKDRFEVALDALKLIYSTKSYRLFVKELCDCFQITGEEKSLRSALDMRSGKPETRALSNRKNFRYLREYGFTLNTWCGAEIFDTTKDSILSGAPDGDSPRVNVLVQEQQGHCVLTCMDYPNTPFASAPLGTKRGDWWLGIDALMSRGEPTIGLIVRPSNKGRYNVIGPTYPLRTDNGSDAQPPSPDNFDGFKGFWHPEDLLILGWTLCELELHKTRQDQTIELINRRICAWDGSSYFEKMDTPPWGVLVSRWGH